MALAAGNYRKRADEPWYMEWVPLTLSIGALGLFYMLGKARKAAAEPSTAPMQGLGAFNSCLGRCGQPGCVGIANC